MVERALRDAVAVLIPVFNDDGRLAETVRSTDREEVPVVVVIVDDGSSAAIAIGDAVTPHEVVILRHPVNRGIEHALNTGLEYIRARGIPYVARLDNGDRSLPGRLTRQRAFLAANPSVHLVGSAVEWRDDDGRSRFTRVFPTTHEGIVNALHHTTALIHPSVMFRTAVLDTAGMYSIEYPAAEDLEYFWRIARRHRVANFAETLVITRFDPDGLSMRRRRQQLRSTLRIQLAHFHPVRWTSWYGVAKTLGRFVIPYGWIVAMKRLATRRRELTPSGPATMSARS
jgi:glycosyltransferase involved in cell wall biosynthesis